MNFNGVKNAGSSVMGTGVVATSQRVAFGTFVRRSADGFIKMVPTGAATHGFLGVANDDIVQHTYDGFYDAGQKVPIIVSGTANAWILGGQTVLSGDYLKFPGTLGAGTEGLGVLYPETTVVKTLDTVAKYVGRADAGDANFDQTVSSISGAQLTIDSAQHLTDLDLCEGDAVIIDSNEAAEFNVISDPDTSTTKCTVEITPLASHANAIKIYKLEQINVLLVD
jgi:hypothetical protein